MTIDDYNEVEEKEVKEHVEKQRQKRREGAEKNKLLKKKETGAKKNKGKRHVETLEQTQS